MRVPVLLTRVSYNGLAQLAPLLIVLGLTPLMFSRLGAIGYGIWGTLLAVLATVRLLDGGVAASMARFFAIYAERSDRTAAARLLVGAIVALTLFGLVLTAISLPLASSAVRFLKFDSDDGLGAAQIADWRSAAADLLRWGPGLAALALIGESASALLIGNGRFRALAAVMWTSSIGFAIAIYFFTEPDQPLEALALAVVIRYAIQAVMSIVLGARQLHFSWPYLPSRATTREFVAYSSRMQLSAASGFVNTQLDALVIATFLGVRYVAYYNVAFQAAQAARSLPLFAFPPMLTRLTTYFERDGREATRAEFARLERIWVPASIGFGSVGVVAILFAVPIWMGGDPAQDEWPLGGAIAAVLLVGYTAHVTLTGMRSCYARAVGRPGMETWSSVMWTLGNLLLKAPGVMLGPIGVVAATSVSGIIASTWFLKHCLKQENLPIIRPPGRFWLAIAIAVAITLGGELAVVMTDWHGFGALVLAGLPAFAGWGAVAYWLRKQRSGY